MAGAQYERDEVNRFLARTLDVIAGVPSSLSNSTATDAAGRTVGEAQNHYALSGYFSRFNYTYKSKYLFEANARYDGSSRFRAEDRWKFFYGFLGGWRITQESFMKNVNFLNELKLRASWGTVGKPKRYWLIRLYSIAQSQLLNRSNCKRFSCYRNSSCSKSSSRWPGCIRQNMGRSANAQFGF